MKIKTLLRKLHQLSRSSLLRCYTIDWVMLETSCLIGQWFMRL